MVNMIGKKVADLGKKELLHFGAPLAKDVLAKLTSKATSSLIDNFEGKKSEWDAVSAGKGFILFFSNEDMDVIIRIIKSLENSGALNFFPEKISSTFY